MIKYKLFLLTIILFLLKSTVFAQCAGCTFTIAGNDAGTYTLNPADVMCISPTGNFTGTVNLNGGRLCNEGILNPSSVGIWNPTTIDNYGTFTANNLSFFSGFTITNHSGGDLTISGTLVLAGTIVNDGTITVGTLLRMNNIGILTNNGTINVPSIEVNDDFNNNGTVTTTSLVMNGGTTTNKGVINTQGTFTHNNGILNNDNLITVTGDFFNHEALNNTNLITVTGNFTNNEPLTNSGCVDTDGNFINNSILTNNATMKISGNFTNNEIVNNNTYLNVIGDFLNNDSFSGTVAPPHARLDIGGESRNNTTLTGFLDFNDTSTPGSIDVNFGTIDANVSFGIANTAGITILPCTLIILPIDLLSFDAKPKGDFVEVYWTTVTETNNAFFSVESSKNGINWKKKINVGASLNPNSISHYSILDKEPYFGTSYYRLKQTDFDGRFDYSQIVSVEINAHKDKKVKIYPNPAKNQLRIEGNPTEITNFKIFNALGQNINNKIKIRTKKNTIYVLDISALSTGFYILKTQTKSLKFHKE